jgi:hypothetical protein
MLGCAATAALLEGARLVTGMDSFLAAACWMFFPAAAAFMAARFARAMPCERQPPDPGTPSVLFRLASGVGVLIVAALVLSKLSHWRAGP